MMGIILRILTAPIFFLLVALSFGISFTLGYIIDPKKLGEILDMIHNGLDNIRTSSKKETL